MKTEVIISIIAVVVILAIIAYVVYKKDRFTLAGTYMTPLQLATQKGYSQIVDYLNEQVENNNAMAQRIVNMINCNGQYGVAGGYGWALGNIANISVPVQNCNIGGGLPTDITSLPHMTPLQIAKQKGDSQLVARINAQVARAPPSIQTAQLLVNIGAIVVEYFTAAVSHGPTISSHQRSFAP